jgi:hypothetical protein
MVVQCADTQSAVAMINGPSIIGVVRFQQVGDRLVADGSIDGLEPDSVHGLHVHHAGDLSQVRNMIEMSEPFILTGFLGEDCNLLTATTSINVKRLCALSTMTIMDNTLFRIKRKCFL